jgi:hypothetical protein
MSATSTASINVPLTTFAQGFVQDRLAAFALARLLCPIVKVTGAAGTFKKFDDRNSFSVVDTQRGLGGTRTRIQYAATDGNYNCRPHGLEVTVDDHEKSLAGASNISDELLSQGKVKAMLSTKATSYAARAVATFLAGMTAVTDRGNWSSDSVDPIDQLDEQLENLATDVGSTENIKLILSTTAFRKLRMNAKAKSRLAGVKTAMKMGDLVDMLMVPVEPLITAASSTVTKPGQTTVAKSNLLGAYAILIYSLPNPTVYDPSAFKCFSTSDVLVESVKTYRDESASSDIHCVDWSEDIQQTSTLAAKLLAIT